MQNGCSKGPRKTSQKLPRWKNLYESDHSMSDEIRYVYNRRSNEAVMGNNLDRPSLLMKRTFVRMTHTNQEDLSKGTTYAKRDLASEA